MKLTNVMFMIAKRKTTQVIRFDHTSQWVNDDVTTILKAGCLSYGTTFDGTIHAIKHHLNIKQKCPVLVSVKHELMFFPIPLVKENHTLWVRYLPTLISKRVENHQCVISYGYQQIYVDVDHRMMNRQIKRCQTYIDKLHAVDLELNQAKLTDQAWHIEQISASNATRKGFS